MKVQILGTGCPNCKRLTDNAEAACLELGVEAEIEKVTDIDKITSYGGDYYYQGYYDYYGYTDKGEKTRRPGKISLTQEELISMKNDDEDFDLGLGESSLGRERKREARREEPVELDADLGDGRSRRSYPTDRGPDSRERADHDDETVVARRMRDDLDIL